MRINKLLIFAINHGVFLLLLCWVFVAVLRLFVVVHRFSPVVVGGFSSCAQASFLSRSRIHIPWLGRQLLNHWTTGEVLGGCFIYLAIILKKTSLPILELSHYDCRGKNGGRDREFGMDMYTLLLLLLLLSHFSRVRLCVTP